LELHIFKGCPVYEERDHHEAQDKDNEYRARSRFFAAVAACDAAPTSTSQTASPASAPASFDAEISAHAQAKFERAERPVE
jgi:hypothetical protein